MAGTSESRLKDFLGFVGSLTYKPGYTFSAYPENGQVVVTLTGWVPDSTAAPVFDKVQIGFTRSISDWMLENMEEDAWDWLIMDLVQDLEGHEMCEWLKCDGKRLHEPTHS